VIILEGFLFVDLRSSRKEAYCTSELLVAWGPLGKNAYQFELALVKIEPFSVGECLLPSAHVLL
jgi:hypothetical protein